MKSKRNVPGYLTDIKYSGGRVGILLFHGLGGTPLEMRYIAQGLSRAGYTVHCPVLPGMTNGTDVLKISTWKDWYNAAEESFDEMRKTCDTVFVGGLSAGSMIALRLSVRHPGETAGHIVFSPTFWPNGWAVPKAFNLFRLVYTNWFARLFNFRQRAPFGIKDGRMRKFMVDSFKNDGRDIADVYARHGRMIFQFRNLTDEVKRHLHKLKQPTIVIHPRHDDQSDLSNALTLQSKLGGPVEAFILDDCYHMIPLDRQRDEVLERTLNFVDRQLVAIGIANERPSIANGAATSISEPSPANDDADISKTVAAE